MQGSSAGRDSPQARKGMVEHGYSEILRNEKYAGDLCQKKTYTPDYLSHANVQPRAEMVYIKDHHEPIISAKFGIKFGRA